MFESLVKCQFSLYSIISSYIFFLNQGSLRFVLICHSGFIQTQILRTLDSDASTLDINRMITTLALSEDGWLLARDEVIAWVVEIPGGVARIVILSSKVRCLLSEAHSWLRAWWRAAVEWLFLTCSWIGALTGRIDVEVLLFISAFTHRSQVA